MDDKASSQSPEVQTRLQAIEEEIFDEDLNWGPYSVGDERVTDLTVFWLSVKRRIENWRKREDSALRAGIFKA